MAASCMAAIGVARHVYVWIGGWRRGSDVVDRHYVDPTVLPTPAAFQLWGWVLSRQYIACHPVPSRERLVLPDPREMPPAE